MTVERPITIYRLLRTIRDRSAKEVADELLVTSSYIGAIEKQIRTPSVRFDRAFAKLMGVPEELIRSFIISEMIHSQPRCGVLRRKCISSGVWNESLVTKGPMGSCLNILIRVKQLY